jgi:hypothetical protein
MRELNDEIIVFPFRLRKFDEEDQEIGAAPKTKFGDIITTTNPENEGLGELSLTELHNLEDRLEEAFDKYGIPLRVERAKKHFERNKRGKR